MKDECPGNQTSDSEQTIPKINFPGGNMIDETPLVPSKAEARRYRF